MMITVGGSRRSPAAPSYRGFSRDDAISVVAPSVNPLTTGTGKNVLVRPGPLGPPHTFADDKEE